MKVCTVEGCDRPHKALGMCSRHYREDLARRKGPCTVDGCDHLQQARGWCQGHYERWRQYRDVHADIPLGSSWTLTPEELAPCGTYASYQRGCRCGRCRKANRDVKRGQYQRQLVPAWPVVRHVNRLVEAGLSRSEVARRAGVPTTTVVAMLRRGGGRVSPHLAEALREIEAYPTVCVDCGGPPMPGGAERCLDCFHTWVDEQRRLRSRAARMGGLLSTRKEAS